MFGTEYDGSSTRGAPSTVWRLGIVCRLRRLLSGVELALTGREHARIATRLAGRDRTWAKRGLVSTDGNMGELKRLAYKTFNACGLDVKRYHPQSGREPSRYDLRGAQFTAGLGITVMLRCWRRTRPAWRHSLPEWLSRLDSLVRAAAGRLDASLGTASPRAGATKDGIAS
jgi:hypothetical protein